MRLRMAEAAVHQSIEGHGNQQAARDIINNYPVQLPQRLPSLLAQIVPILSQRNDPDTTIPLGYEIGEKISYNNLITFRMWINEYGSYGSIVDSVYLEFETLYPGAKARILRQFLHKYLEKKIAILALARANGEQWTYEIDVIRQHADEIMHHVYDQVIDGIQSSLAPDIAIQDVGHSAMVLVCHAFINCKILERPEGND